MTNIIRIITRIRFLRLSIAISILFLIYTRMMGRKIFSPLSHINYTPKPQAETYPTSAGGWDGRVYFGWT